jgi:mannitol-1-/sugar-/sorbitol-6-phosphatase
VTRPAAALFDMDGTLVDSTATVELVWTEVANAHGWDPAELLAVSHGVRADDTMRRYLPEHEIADAVAALQTRELELVDGTVEVPGAAEFVRRLETSGVPWAVVTSAPAPLARARILAAGLDLPEVLVSAADVTAGKPHPEGYLQAASRLAVDPTRCVVFEDADAGVRAGLAAGARVVVVGTGESATMAGLTRIRDYRDLLDGAVADPFA